MKLSSFMIWVWNLHLIPIEKNDIFSRWYNNVYYILNNCLHIKIATYIDMCRLIAGDMYFKTQASSIFTLNFVYCIFCLLFYKYIWVYVFLSGISFLFFFFFYFVALVLALNLLGVFVHGLVFCSCCYPYCFEFKSYIFIHFHIFGSRCGTLIMLPFQGVI
jgi:hypothetical protein